jgi:L-ribulose-5-phosphate 4-epimerase
MLLLALRKEIVEVGRRMQKDGLAHDGQGNISIFARDAGLVAITPSAVPYDERTPKDICVTDLNGALVDGCWKPTSELALHLIYYRNSADTNAVVHTHAPFTTVFGIIGESCMPVVLNEAAMGLGGPLPVAPYARPGTQELAEVTYQASKDSVGAIMAHHGLLTFGTNLERAYGSTLAAEATARIIILARSMGVQPITIEPSVARELRQGFLQSYHPERKEP